MITPDAVEAAARAMADDWNPGRDPVLTAMFRDYAQTAVAAAAPLIAQQTLIDAAQAWSADIARAHGTPAELFLTARASTLTPKEN